MNNKLNLNMIKSKIVKKNYFKLGIILLTFAVMLLLSWIVKVVFKKQNNKKIIIHKVIKEKFINPYRDIDKGFGSPPDMLTIIKLDMAKGSLSENKLNLSDLFYDIFNEYNLGLFKYKMITNVKINNETNENNITYDIVNNENDIKVYFGKVKYSFQYKQFLLKTDTGNNPDDYKINSDGTYNSKYVKLSSIKNLTAENNARYSLKYIFNIRINDDIIYTDDFIEENILLIHNFEHNILNPITITTNKKEFFKKIFNNIKEKKINLNELNTYKFEIIIHYNRNVFFTGYGDYETSYVNYKKFTLKNDNNIENLIKNNIFILNIVDLDLNIEQFDLNDNIFKSKIKYYVDDINFDFENDITLKYKLIIKNEDDSFIYETNEIEKNIGKNITNEVLENNIIIELNGKIAEFLFLLRDSKYELNIQIHELSYEISNITNTFLKNFKTYFHDKLPRYRSDKAFDELQVSKLV